MIIDTIKKVTSTTGTLPPVLLDLTQDTVTPNNLEIDQTAHNSEGYPITGQMVIEDAEAWAVGTKNGVPVAETDLQFQNNSKYYATVSGSILQIAGQHASAAATSANNAEHFKDMAQESSVISGSFMRIAGEYADKSEEFSVISGSYMNIAGNYKKESEAWAVGTKDGVPVPVGDETYQNSSKYWAQEAQVSATGIIPKGTCLFADLPSVENSNTGDMWNIEDEFITTSDFREGAGHPVSPGSNVYMTIDHKWDVMAGFISDMSGATSTTNGKHGLFPAPLAGEQDKVLYGDGNYDYPATNLIAPIETTSISQHAYSIGQQFIHNRILYTATQAIAVGDEIEVGINCIDSQTIIEQIQGITSAYVTGVKGNTESTYRTGNVNITPANIGAVALSESALQIITNTNGDTPLALKGTSTGTYLGYVDKNDTSLGYIGINTNKQPTFYDGTSYKIYTQKDTIPIANGGTGATTAQNARANLGLGTSAQNFRVTNPSASGQSIYFRYVDQNANSAYNDKELIFLIADYGVVLWDNIDAKNIWSINNTPITKLSTSNIVSGRLTIQSGGGISYLVKNGICFVRFSKVNVVNAAQSWAEVLTGLPKAIQYSTSTKIVNSTSPIQYISVYIYPDSTSLYLTAVNTPANASADALSISYPVSF